MTIQKIRQPVEYSFLQWINGHPDSGHWADHESFLIFTKTVCRYHATKWQNSNYLKKRIIEAKPLFNSDFLDHIISLYNTLIQFYKTTPCLNTKIVKRDPVKKGHYFEIRVKKGKICEVEIPRGT
jgi:hypothetical protein